MGEITFFKIEIPKNIWFEFKRTMDKTQTINNTIITLIKQRIEDFKKNK